MKRNQFIRLICTATAALGLVAGCGTTAGYKQADKTGAGIAEFRDEVVKAQRAVNETVKALDQISATANTNPRKAYEQFSGSVTTLEAAYGKAAKRGQEMKARGRGYFTEWEKQMGEVNNPQIRQLAMERKAKLSETFDSIQQLAEPLKVQFDPWVSNLRDLKTYLGNDLTIAGVEAAKSLFAKANTEGLEVQKSMDALVAELNTVAATITPARSGSK